LDVGRALVVAGLVVFTVLARLPERPVDRAGAVRPDRFTVPARQVTRAHHPRRTMPVQPLAISGREDRSFAALTDGRSIARAVRGASGMVTTLPPYG